MSEVQTPDYEKIIDVDAQRARIHTLILQTVARGEQPDEAIDSLPGALRGDVPLSRTDQGEV